MTKYFMQCNTDFSSLESKDKTFSKVFPYDGQGGGGRGSMGCLWRRPEAHHQSCRTTTEATNTTLESRTPGTQLLCPRPEPLGRPWQKSFLAASAFASVPKVSLTAASPAVSPEVLRSLAEGTRCSHLFEDPLTNDPLPGRNGLRHR